ncbi:MAG: hypothetical protein GC204_16470 [Chloroflexi bacterium]|nr:hypothetical protein [Chloroflexota bacterium]
MIHLQIDRLVLHGFDPRHRHRIGDAFELEFNALLAEQGLPPNLNSNEIEIPLAQIEIAPELRPEEAGAEIARAVYGWLVNDLG